MSLYDAMSGGGDAGVSRHGLHESKVLGVMIGVVSDNQDPDRLGRVKVRLPRLTGEDESAWARIVTFMAGPDMGAVFIPEVDDEVLVAFEQGDVNLPYVLGSLHNGRDAAPYANADGLNKERVIKSKSGHVIRLDDTPGLEKIEIIDKTGQNMITIDSSENKIKIEAKAGIELKVGDDGDFTMSAKQLNFEASDAINFTATGAINVTSSDKVNVIGPEINLN
ncbi:MAG: phage baseplate assembly protein V [bacterium]|nr:phage baseplate assembly protein V [bacterium]